MPRFWKTTVTRLQSDDYAVSYAVLRIPGTSIASAKYIATGGMLGVCDFDERQWRQDLVLSSLVHAIRPNLKDVIQQDIGRSGTSTYLL